MLLGLRPRSIAVVGLLLTATSCAQPLSFTLHYCDAAGLQPGQFVVYRGVRIGEVVDVRLVAQSMIEVDVVVDDEHLGKIYHEARYVIEKPSLLDVGGEKQITVKDSLFGDGPRTPIRTGDHVAGDPGLIGRLKGLMGSSPC